MPPALRNIADRIGAPAALALARRWGGRRLYVPHRVGAEHAITETIGLEHARALSSLYAGEFLDIPRPDGVWRARRDAEIRAHRAAGWTMARLASTYALTVRQIHNIVAESGSP